MKTYECPKCKSTDLFLNENGSQKGLYCGDCGAWIKWVNKSEIQLVERFLQNKEENKQYTLDEIVNMIMQEKDVVRFIIECGDYNMIKDTLKKYL